MTTALAVTTTKTHQAGVDLLRIVRINEEIKSVVNVAFKINIMALNAIFLAKRAGTAARGFGVLSNELRVFSQDLRDCMLALTGLVHGCVNDVSLMLQDIRHTRLLRQAVALSKDAQMASGAGPAGDRERTPCGQPGQPAQAAQAGAGRCLPVGRAGRGAGQVGQDRGGLRAILRPAAGPGVGRV